MAAGRGFTFRISAEGVEQLERELNQLGSRGEQAFQKLVTASPQLAQALDRVGQRAENLADKTRRSFAQQGEAVQLAAHQVTNLGNQVQDFAVQIYSGQSALTALAQQAPQAISAVGGLSVAWNLLNQTILRSPLGGVIATAAALAGGIYALSKATAAAAETDANHLKVIEDTNAVLKTSVEIEREKTEAIKQGLIAQVETDLAAQRRIQTEKNLQAEVARRRAAEIAAENERINLTRRALGQPEAAAQVPSGLARIITDANRANAVVADLEARLGRLRDDPAVGKSAEEWKKFGASLDEGAAATQRYEERLRLWSIAVTENIDIGTSYATALKAINREHEDALAKINPVILAYNKLSASTLAATAAAQADEAARARPADDIVAQRQQRANQLTQQAETAQARYNRTVAEYKGLLQDGLITRATFNALEGQAGEALTKAGRAAEKTKVSYESLNASVRDATDAALAHEKALRSGADTVLQSDAALANAITRDAFTPLERLNEQIAIRRRLLDTGRITEETFRRSVEKLNEDFRAQDKAVKAAEKALEDWQKARDRAIEKSSQRLVDLGADTFFDVFTGRAEDAWEAFKDFGLRVLSQLAAEALIRPIVMPLVAGAVDAAPGLFGLGAQPAGVAGAAGQAASLLNTASGLTSGARNLFSFVSDPSGFFNGLANHVGQIGGLITGAGSSAAALGTLTSAGSIGVFTSEAALAGSSALAGGAGAAGSLGGIGSAIGAAAPYAAAAIAAAVILSSLLGKKSVGPTSAAEITFGDGRFDLLGIGTDNGGSRDTARQYGEALTGFFNSLRDAGADIRLGADRVFNVQQNPAEGFRARIWDNSAGGWMENVSVDRGGFDTIDEAIIAGIRAGIETGDFSVVGADVAGAVARSTQTELAKFTEDIAFAASFADQLALMNAWLDPVNSQLAQINAQGREFGDQVLRQVKDFQQRAADLGLIEDPARARELQVGLERMVLAAMGIGPEAKEMSGLELALAQGRSRIDAFKDVLLDLGFTAERSAELIGQAQDALLGRTQAQFSEGLIARHNDALGLGVLNSLGGIVGQARADSVTNATLYGGSPQQLGATQNVINAIFNAQVGAALEGLGGDARALQAVVDQFGGSADAASAYVAALAQQLLDGLVPAAGAAARALTDAGRRLVEDLAVRELRVAGDDRGALVEEGALRRARELAAAFDEGLDPEQLARLAAVIDGELATALADFDAQVAASAQAIADAAAAAARASRDFDDDLRARELRAGGDDRGAFLAELQARQRAEIEAAEAAGRTTEQIDRLAAVLALELTGALADFDEQATGVAGTLRDLAAEAARVNADVNVRFLRASGQTLEADLAAIDARHAQERLDAAANPEIDLARLEEVQQLERQAIIDDFHARQLEAQRRAAEAQLAEQRRAAEEAQRIAEQAAREAERLAAEAARREQQRVDFNSNLLAQVLDAQGRTAEAEVVRLASEAQGLRRQAQELGGDMALVDAYIRARRDQLVGELLGQLPIPGVDPQAVGQWNSNLLQGASPSLINLSAVTGDRRTGSQYRYDGSIDLSGLDFGEFDSGSGAPFDIDLASLQDPTTKAVVAFHGDARTLLTEIRDALHRIEQQGGRGGAAGSGGRPGGAERDRAPYTVSQLRWLQARGFRPDSSRTIRSRFELAGGSG